MSEISELNEKIDALYQSASDTKEEMRQIARAQEETLQQLDDLKDAVGANTNKLDRAVVH